jgi:hypothetical protein
MASSSLRSAPENWLIGKPISQLSTARLPRMLDVLQLLQFHHFIEGRTLPESYKMACDAVIFIWMRARIPTQRVDSCVRKLSKLHENYLALKVHRKRQRESDRMKEDMFKGDLQELFDIATKDVMTEIQNEEDREFLRMQREDVFSCSMSGVDVKTAAKESRKRQREEKERKVKMRYEERLTKRINETECELSSLPSSSESEQDEEYQATQTQSCTDYTPTTSTATDSTACASSSRKKFKNIFQSTEVVGALDRVCLPDRGAVFVAGAVAQALGHDISELTLSRSSIRRSRIKERQRAAAMDEKEFSLTGPLLLHWDGKILPDIAGSKENVDRIAVIVTGNGQEKLLAIPKMDRGTGEAQANACIEVIDKWNLRSQIKGLVFDTTASNTGLHNGACVRTEEALGTEMVWIACRHHVMEVVLSNVFTSLFGATEGPSTALFKRFQKQWPSMNQDAHCTTNDELFQDPILKNMRQEMLDYLPTALETQQPRDDYKEFLCLSFWFLGGHKGSEKFRAPGPTHHARWMAKAIYALKIFLFKSQLKLTASESKNITDLALFVSLVYVKQWNEASLGIRAPLNDIEFLSSLKTYPNKKLASKAHEAFSRHLWFLSEHLVGMAFFDDRVSASTKEKMVQNIHRPPLADTPRRLKLTSESEQLKLEDLVTERTTSFFDVLMEEGKEKSQTFLKKPPGQWTSDPVFKMFYELAAHMRVVNDVAERGISLIEKYNDTLTKNEEQKQFILRLVANHRKNFPTPSKTSLMS